MAPSAPAISPTATGQLLQTLLNCSPEELPRWIETHRSQLHLPLLQALKDTYAITTYILAEPVIAERATRYGLIVAAQMGEEALALPLARWARGVWAMFHAPEEAITLFQQAQAAYRKAGNDRVVAFLNTNLVGVLAECGRFAEAEIAYAAARPELAKLVDEQPIYLLWLDQNYGWLLHNQGRYPEALSVLDQALFLARKANLPANITGIQVNRYLTLGMLGRLGEVEAGFGQERDAAQAQQQIMTVARIDMNLGDLYSVQGRPAAALRCFQMAQQNFTLLGNQMEVGSVTLRQASLLRRIGARRAALRYYEDALAIFQQNQMLPQVGEVLVNYAMTRRLEGEYRHAARLLEQAETVWQELNNQRWLVQIYFERILLALAREEYAHAETLLQTPPALAGNAGLEAEFQLLQTDTLRWAGVATKNLLDSQNRYQAVYHYAKQQNLRWLQRRSLLGLGKLLLAADPQQAIQFFEEAAALDEAIRQTLNVEELKASFHEQANDLFDDLIRFHLSQEQSVSVLGYVWRAKAGAMLDLLQNVQGEITLSSTEESAIEVVRQRLATIRWEQALQQRDPTLPPENEATNAEIGKLEQQLLALRQQQNYTRQETMPGLATVNPQALLQEMESDILLEYMQCGDELVGIYADRFGKCVATVLGDIGEIIDLSARLQLRFGNVVARPNADRQKYAEVWRQEALPLLATCYRRLVAPLLAHAPEAQPAQSVLIAPCDPLFLLPFAAFWDGAHYLHEQYQLEMIPCGALLLAPPPGGVACSPPVIIAAASGAMTAVHQEANAIATVLQHSVTFIDVPVLTYLQNLTAPPRIVHIAAHSLIRADAPLFTALQLTGEILSVEQCYELPLKGAELVTLSGCTTASGMESDSNLLAFQSALLIAGAQRVLCSLWPVSDEATVLWMSHFYRCLAHGYAVSQAVQQVQHLLRNDPACNHPAIWAAFASTRR